MEHELKRLMIVYDEKAFVDSVEVVFTMMGYDIITANSVVSAIGKAREFNPEVIVTDVRFRDGTVDYLLDFVERELPQTKSGHCHFSS